MLYVGSICTGASLVFLFPSYLWVLVAGLGPFFSFLHYLELSKPHCLDHGAIPLSLSPFLAGDFYLYPLLFPRQHSQTGGRVNCVRVRNWGTKMSYCHSAACHPVPMSQAVSSGAMLAQNGLQGCALPTCLSSCVCMYT